MKASKKGNLLIILTIAIIAFGSSNVVASITDGESILNLFNITSNETTKLVAVGDGNFSPSYITKIAIVNNTTNATNNTNTTTNKTTESNVTEAIKNITTDED